MTNLISIVHPDGMVDPAMSESHIFPHIHSMTGNKCIVQGQGHNNLPNFIGHYFPRHDDPDQYPFYCTSMLMLLKPWRNLDTNLKSPSQTWESAFETFISTAPRQIHHIISGIQYFHKCELSAQQHSADNVSTSQPTELHSAESEKFDLGKDHETETSTQPTLSEEGLAQLITSQVNWWEDLHGRLAVEAAKVTKVFNDSDPSTPAIQPSLTTVTDTSNTGNSLMGGQSEALGAYNAGDGDLRNLLSWKQQMVQDAMITWAEMLPNLPTPNSGGPPSVWYLDSTETLEASLTPVNPSQLHYDQFHAYDIVTWHLDQMLAGHKPPLLRMLIHSEGGTDKSKVIQTITKYFTQRGSKHMLLKVAYTGVAASLIDGKTTHTIAMISHADETTMGAETKGKLQAFWKYVLYLIIDEMLMIKKTFLAKLSCNISIGKMVEGLGRAIYKEFTTVIVLKEQMCVMDQVWHDFLQHLRYG
ncbi:hypothetical protein PAXINDRAFT_151861 [Paxillus involutus ATCC 200175]|nr:hypothetical protein PAXINDRAFT_151861 [Paxillus involutus ATCC 200175]